MPDEQGELTNEDFESPQTDAKDTTEDEKPTDTAAEVETAETAETVEESSDDEVPEELKTKDLPPELEKHRKGMHRAMTKGLEKVQTRLAELDDYEKKAEVVDNFFNDKAYAGNLLKQYATANGYSLVPTSQVGKAQATGDVSPDAVEAVKKVLPAELQAFAPAFAAASNVLLKQNNDAQEAAQQEKNQEQRLEAIDEMISEMDVDTPGWQEHQDDMIELLNYLESGDFTHKRFGSKGKLLYNIITGNAKAVDEAAGRMRSAARHKGVKQQASAGPKGIAERIRDAKTDDEVWDLSIADAVGKFPNLPD